MRFGPPGFSRTMASKGRGAGGSRAMLGEKRCWQEGRDVDAGTGKRRKSGLTRDGIVDAAYRMIDRDGMGAFTMRALGAELGVSAMAFYAHFSSREEVLVAVLTRFMETLDTDPVPGERWDDTLRRTMTSIHREYCAHPHMNDIDLDPRIAYEGLAAHTEKIVSLHLDQGMPEPVLTKAWAMIDAFLTGFNGSAIAAAQRRQADEEAGAAVDDAPVWQRIVDAAYSEESFANGVEMIIMGVRGLASPDPCAWRTPE